MRIEVSMSHLMAQCYSAIFRMRAQHTGLDHLRWIYTRLIKVHGENPNVDYMLTLKDIISDLEKVEMK